MKTQIIQLNQNDDYISVRDRIGWSQTGRVLLVLPSRNLFQYRRLEINLIHRHANALGAQLALITKDAEIRFNARLLGIPVYKNLHRAQNSHWRISKPKDQTHPTLKLPSQLENVRELAHPQRDLWMHHPATRILCFGMSVLALFALGVFILPAARVTLTPLVETQSLTLAVNSASSLDAVNFSTGSLPTEVREVVVEGREKMNVTGTTSIPDQAAYGSLQFTNITDHTIKIPPETIVSTLGSEPIRFITLSRHDITIEPGNSVMVSAHAITPGKSGNLLPDSLIAIEGDFGLDAVVTNPYSTRGGTDASVSAPSTQDLQSLEENLTEKLEHAAIEELHAYLSEGDVLITPTVKLVNVLDKTITPTIGEPGRELNISLRLQFQSEVVTGDVLKSLVTPIMDAAVKPGYSNLDDTVLLTQTSSFLTGPDGKTHWTLHAQRRLEAEIHWDESINEIKGLSISQAQEKLDELLPIAGQVQIMLSPTWWPRLPYFPMRIQLIQAEP